MTPFLQRTVLILLGGSALCASAVTAHAQLFRPSYPIHMPAAGPAPVASQGLQPAVSRDEPRPQLILAATHRRARTTAPKGPPATVTVRKGDTLDEIADRLDVTVEQLKAANGLKRNTIQPGDVLKNPKASSKAKGSKASAADEPRAAAEGYTVKRGDTIFSISKRLGITEAELRQANGLSKKAQILAGQKLKVSGGAEAADAEAAENMARQASRPDRRSTRSRDVTPADDTESRSATGRVVTVEGQAASYTVRKGDNLAKIADKLNTTVEALKKDNRLKSSSIQPGRVLKGPSTTAKAYVAASGDTLDDVAKRFGVTAKALRAENGLGRGARIRSGQKLRLPAGYRDRGPVKTYAPAPYEPARERSYEPPRITPPSIRAEETPAALPLQPQPYTPSPSTPRPYTPPTTVPSRPGTAPPLAPQAAPPATDAQISALGRGKFVWPVQGTILSEFGPKAGGQRNDGVNVQAQAGDPVRAAAAGDVVYAGDQVPGFGNLVLIKHADGWVTAYGHLSSVEVKMQQRVTQGQQIGQAGSTGGVPEPQLHFEVRYAPSPLERARPIDPRLVLPR
jgi:murein DD-endopeptidase MepM/ murein hydrolase activator NlpD